MRSLFRAVLLTLLLVGAPARAADLYADKVLPFLNEYCVRCHDAKTKKGELDLTRYPTTGRLLEDFRQWEHVVGFLKKEEMPPAKAKQPSVELRAEMVAAIEKVLLTEARKLAGDPGVVPPRRLTNAEYDHTIADLTGVDIRPARLFPVDPASGEGFSNTGEALTLSPGLFKKYYGAAEQIADHALLTTEGLRFAPHPVVAFADRQKAYEQQILRFYETHAVDVEKTLTALLIYRNRPAGEKDVTVEARATQLGISPKYARLLWDALEGKSDDRFHLRWLRLRWAALPEPAQLKGEIRTLANDIRLLSLELTPTEVQAIVANAGNGPVDHLARRRRMAETRDAFDRESMTNRKFTLELKPTDPARLTIDAVQVGELPAGYVHVKVTIAGGENKKRSLRDVLTESAPETAAKLRFGAMHPDHPNGDRPEPDAIVLKVPSTLNVDLPTGKLTLTAEVKLDRATPGATVVRMGRSSTTLIDPKHKLAADYDASASAFCRLFPNRFYHVDSTRGLSAGFHLIEGFFRDDQPLCRSVLSDTEKSELDRLWRELYFVTGIWEKMLRGFVFFERSERNFLKHPDFDAFKEEDPDLAKDETLARFQDVYLKRSGVKATGDELAKHPISVFFTEVRGGLRDRADTLEKAEAIYLRDLFAFAERAFRRPLTEGERQKLEKFYTGVCRDKDHGIEAAVRASLVRLLVSPHFCLRFDPTPAGTTVAPLPDLTLASRLSYFLWAGPPDDELLSLAKAGKLRDDRVLREQVQRMRRDPKVSRFAQEFFGQWLGYHDFLTQEAVNRQVFPAFDDALKQAMFEEPTRLTADLIRRDQPISELLNGDATFVNKPLAKHYGLPPIGDDWQLVTGLRQQGRSGLMGMAVFLTKNSQPQRTSPVKRGFWVVHKLLGEHIPPPPPDVAVLPAKETDTNGKTIRELLKLHVEDVKCASCHQRFDPVGLAMEGFDPIGKARAKDLAGRAIDSVVALPSGKQARGVPEFGDHLATARKADFNRTLCHKLLGFALGRSLLLSDQPLLDRMQAEMQQKGDRLAGVFEMIATSPQFLNQRCKDFTPTRFSAEPPAGGSK